MVIVVWRDMNTYQGVMYSKNGESFICNPFYAGRMYREEWVMC